MPFYETDKILVLFNSRGEVLQAKGAVDIVKGWKQLFAKEINEDGFVAQSLPLLMQDQYCRVIDHDIRTLKTKPPAYYTEGTLLGAMKNAAK